MPLWLNVAQCNCVSFGKRPRKSYYTISDETLHKSDTVKNLGIIFDTQLKFVDHINNKINKAYQILGIIKRNFIYLTPRSFLILYKFLVRSHLEYGVSVWSPHHEYIIEKLEIVQKRATKLIISIKHLKYEEVKIYDTLNNNQLSINCMTRLHSFLVGCSYRTRM